MVDGYELLSWPYLPFFQVRHIAFFAENHVTDDFMKKVYYILFLDGGDGTQ